LTKGKHAFLSQHIGDLENVASYGFFEEAIEHLERVLEIKPCAIAYDLHPEYFSTKWARAQKDVRLVGVQHHHAHIVSCMAENQLDGAVIGFALDGTGYGTDGHIWGGEVLVADYRSFERAAHFEYVPMPGGEMAIREPWRMAVSILAHHFGKDFPSIRVPFVESLECSKTNLILRMVEQKLNAPLTSSCGRLFDAVAALVGVRSSVNYEAQAAIELEMSIRDGCDDYSYPVDLVENNGTWILSTRSTFQSMVDDLVHQLPVAGISQRFHNGLVRAFAKIAGLVREKTLLDRVCLGGGTFHNTYLLRNLTQALVQDGFEVFTPREVPAGDGGLSLGQAVIAHHRLLAR
jgi:hydrogenase maturation protein HypF